MNNGAQIMPALTYMQNHNADVIGRFYEEIALKFCGKLVILNFVIVTTSP